MADRVLNVKVKMAGAVKAQQSLSKIEKGGKKVGGAFAFMKKNWMGLVAGFAVAAMAMRGVIRFFGNAVAAANEQEMAVNQLNAAMKANADFTVEASQAVQDYAASIQQQTTYGDEALIQVAATIKAVGQLGNEALPTATKATVQIAQMFKMNLTSAALLVGKTLTGTTNAFQRYGLEIDMTGDKQERLNELLEKTSAGWTMATAATETQAGKIQQLKNAWGDFTEVLGSFITESDAATGAIDDTRAGVEAFTDFMKDQQNKKAIEGFINDVAYSFKVASRGITADTTAIIKAWNDMQIKAGVLKQIIPALFDDLKSLVVAIWKDMQVQAKQIWSDIGDTIVYQVKRTYEQVRDYFRRMKNILTEWSLGFGGSGVGYADPIAISARVPVAFRAMMEREDGARRAMAGPEPRRYLSRAMTGGDIAPGRMVELQKRLADLKSGGAPNQVGLGFAQMFARSYRGGSPMAALGTSVGGMVSEQVGGMVSRTLGSQAAAGMFGAGIGAFGGPVGTIIGSLIGSLVGGLFGKKKRMQVTEAIAVKDMAMRDLLSQLLNVTKLQLNRRGAGGIDRLNNLRMAQQVVG